MEWALADAGFVYARVNIVRAWWCVGENRVIRVSVVPMKVEEGVRLLWLLLFFLFAVVAVCLWICCSWIVAWYVVCSACFVIPAD